MHNDKLTNFTASKNIKMKLKIYFPVIFAFAIVFGIKQQVLAVDLKIAIVKMNTVINKSKYGIQVIKQIKLKAEVRQKYLQKLAADFRQKQADLSQGGILMRQDAKTKLEIEIRELQKQIQKEEQITGKEVQEFQREQIKQLVNEIKPVIKKIANEKNLDLVIESQMENLIFYSRSNMLDITEEVLRLYNSSPSSK